MLDLFEQLALQAGRVIMEFHRARPEVEVKPDQSPVTQADRAAEEIILRGLRSTFPGVACVAEEEIAAGVVCEIGGGPFILIDPLDGTREFIGNKPDFTVNIALVRDGAPSIGVVFAPAREVMYSARPGEAWQVEVTGEFTASDRRPIAVRACPDTPVILASRSHRTPETDAFIAGMPGAETIAIGSSLKFCLLASGEADIYPRFGRTMEWDTAAGDAILRAAGGRTFTTDGKPLRYGKNNLPGEADFANPWFIATGANCEGLEAATASALACKA